jgi:hypothetical protein
MGDADLRLYAYKQFKYPIPNVLREQNGLIDPYYVCIFSIFEPVEQYLHTWYSYYITGDHSNLVIFSFLCLVITALVRGEKHLLYICT